MFLYFIWYTLILTASKKGNPITINELLNQLKAVVGGNMNLLAIHCHDTYGMALVNIIQGS